MRSGCQPSPIRSLHFPLHFLSSTTHLVSPPLLCPSGPLPFWSSAGMVLSAPSAPLGPTCSLAIDILATHMPCVRQRSKHHHGRSASELHLESSRARRASDGVGWQWQRGGNDEKRVRCTSRRIGSWWVRGVVQVAVVSLVVCCVVLVVFEFVFVRSMCVKGM